MKFHRYILLLPFLCWGFDVKAQLPEELSSMPEQWQLTLDVIKSKAQTLAIKNNGLQVENQQLIGQLQKLQQSIADQQYKNQQMMGYIKERHGRTDQQVHAEELAQIIKIKKPQARLLDGQLGNLQWKKSGLDQKIEKLKYTISDIELHQQAEKEKAAAPPVAVQPQDDAQWVALHKQVEDEIKQEVLLENELAALKTGDKAQDVNVGAVELENKQLESHLDMLRLRKLQQVKKSSDAFQAQVNGTRYAQLKRRKEELEVNINAYELRLDQLRESSLMSLSWPVKKKRLVHQMVQIDARNNQMRGKIKVLREDIDVLREQVAKLERRLDFSQGKDVTFKNTP